MLVASLGADGPESMKHCLENINQLRRIPDIVDEIQTEAKSAFKDLKTVVQQIIVDDSESEKNDNG